MALQKINGYNFNEVEVPDADTQYDSNVEALLYEIWQSIENINVNVDLSNYARLNAVDTNGNSFLQPQRVKGAVTSQALINGSNPSFNFELTDDALHTSQAQIGWNDPTSLTSRYLYIMAGSSYTELEKPSNAIGLHVAIRTGVGGANHTSFWRNGNVGIGYAYNNGTLGGVYRDLYKLGINGKLAVANVPEYADNAAALAGGELAGGFYRITGTGNVQVVI